MHDQYLRTKVDKAGGHVIMSFFRIGQYLSDTNRYEAALLRFSAYEGVSLVLHHIEK
jgi:hypothetical protein